MQSWAHYTNGLQFLAHPCRPGDAPIHTVRYTKAAAAGHCHSLLISSSSVIHARGWVGLRWLRHNEAQGPAKRVPAKRVGWLGGTTPAVTQGGARAGEDWTLLSIPAGASAATATASRSD